MDSCRVSVMTRGDSCGQSRSECSDHGRGTMLDS